MSDQELLNAILRIDLNSFIERSFTELCPNEAYLGNWHIDALAWRLQQVADRKVKRLIINMPPRYLKSISVSVAFTAWVLGHSPTERIISASYAEGLAKKFSRDTRLLMETPFYRRLFSDTELDKSTEIEITTTAGGSRLAASVDGILTGRGGNVLIIDDPMKSSDAASATERKRVKDWYDGTLSNRLDDKANGVIIIVGHRLHQDDLFGHVLGKADDWVQLSLPAVETVQTSYPIGPTRKYVRRIGEPLHIVREDRQALEKIRRQVGSSVYEAQYQQAPLPPEGNLIKQAWFRTYSQPPALGQFEQVVQSWDTANKIGEENDYSVCTTWGIAGNRYYLIDVWRDRVEFPQLCRQVTALADRFKPRRILIEDANNGQALIQTLQRESRLNVIPLRSKLDKATRVSQQSAVIEAGRAHLPQDAAWLGEFMAEVLGFPNARYDDQVDSLEQFLRWASEDGGRSSLFECDWGDEPVGVPSDPRPYLPWNPDRYF